MLSFLLGSCQGNETTTQSTAAATKSDTKNLTPVAEQVSPAPDTVAATSPANNKQKLALTSNALQLVDAVTGSTKEIAFGMPFEQLVTLVSRVLGAGPTSVGVNTECGAGPLKMATWPNGLTLVFGEKERGNAEWLFAGWFAGKPTTSNVGKPETMAGVGVGSTLEELESAYVTSVTKTTLGQEFSVKSGFYGLLSGTGKQATIEVMWSGTSCNFRQDFTYSWEVVGKVGASVVYLTAQQILAVHLYCCFHNCFSPQLFLLLFPKFGYFCESPNQQDKEWFGRVDNVSPDNKVELSICVDDEHEDLTEKIVLVKKFAADYHTIIENIYRVAYIKYKDTKWEKPLDGIKRMYFLTGVNLKSDNKTWWLVLEPTFDVESIYNHFLRFTMVDREIVWANFDINTTA